MIEQYELDRAINDARYDAEKAAVAEADSVRRDLSHEIRELRDDMRLNDDETNVRVDRLLDCANDESDRVHGLLNKLTARVEQLEAALRIVTAQQKLPL